MGEEARTIDLNSERAFRFVELTKVYLLKVTFNLRTLIYHVPKAGKYKHAIKKYQSACRNAREPSLSALSDKAASEVVYQYYRYTGLRETADIAGEKYTDFYNDLMSRLKLFKQVKSLGKWRATSKKRRLRIYNAAKDVYNVIPREYMEDINRLLAERARVLGAKKDIIWNEYLKDPEPFEEGMNSLI